VTGVLKMEGVGVYVIVYLIEFAMVGAPRSFLRRSGSVALGV
jgi:hypothetical protein